MERLLSTAFGIVFFPITLIASWVVVHPQEEVIVLIWGRFWKVLDRPGLSWINVFGRKLIRISRRQQTIELPKNTVADGNGNPIIVSGIVTFAFSDSRKAGLEVENAHEFVRTQAMAVLKQVASKYPYESRDGASLKSEAAKIGIEMVETLQKKIDPAGAKAISFELSDLSYAPEIAQSMLIRQQAGALVDARKIIVEGAVEIVHEAVQLLQKRDLALTGENRERLVTNLLTVICGEAKVQPTVSIGGSEKREDLAPVLEKMVQRLEKLPVANGKT
ncbi:MAG TPA: SPFH domain-containing protein [Planctomycetota bacterium]|nr:SPFH domain-containing protein [Planctomycetota bacterium]